jgi:hypothetical protein
VKPKPGRRPFVSLGPGDFDALGVEASGLFLGRFDAAALRRELEQAGLLSALAERGYPELVLLSFGDSSEYRLEIRARRGRVPLLDLRLNESSSPVEEPLARAQGLAVLSLLTIRWLALQHPKGRFTPERPRLPGQRFPGLGLGRAVVLWLLRSAKAWGKDGLGNVPQHYHNAVFYTPLFRFLAPERQGRFEALRRDLQGLPVATASAAVEAGHVLATPGDEPYLWTPESMASPLTSKLRDYLDSAGYRAAVDKSRESVRFRLA